MLERRAVARITAALCLYFVFPSAGLAQDASPPAEAVGPQIVLHTSMGDIALELDPAHAPITVANFLRYVREGHYNGVAIYRVAPHFVIQTGSYEANGNYRPGHDPIALEANNGLMNLRGNIAMARSDDPNSATAEFFIDLSDNAALDHHADDPGNTTGYAVFGHVTGGMDIVDAISAVPLGDNGPFPGEAPVTPVVISKAEIVKTP